MMFISTDDEEVASINELTSNFSDRAAGVLGGAVLERKLTYALKGNLYLIPNIEEKMFHSSGPLGSFSAKIDLGFMIGMYRQEVWKEIVTIKNIRNDFAHRLSARSFEDQRINSLCQNLRIFEVTQFQTGEDAPHTPPAPFSSGQANLEESLKNGRHRYLSSIAYFGLCLHYWADLLK